jgi:hypothetical protein
MGYKKKVKGVTVDLETYEALCKLGGFHESFNDVINRLLRDNGVTINRSEKEKVPQGASIGSAAPSGRGGSSNTNILEEEDAISVR